MNNNVKPKKDLRMNKEQEKLFNDNIRLAYKLANVFSKKYDLNIDDSISICLESLVRAIKEYKPRDKNSKLSAWISLVVESKMKSASSKDKNIQIKELENKRDIILQSEICERCLDTSMACNEIMTVLDMTLKQYTEDEQQIFKEITFNNRTLMEVGAMFDISHTSVANIVKRIRTSFHKSFYLD